MVHKADLIQLEEVRLVSKIVNNPHCGAVVAVVQNGFHVVLTGQKIPLNVTLRLPA